MIAQIVDEHTGDISFWSGHGHAFLKTEPIACVTMQAYPSSETRVKDLPKLFLEDLDLSDVDGSEETIQHIYCAIEDMLNNEYAENANIYKMYDIPEEIDDDDDYEGFLIQIVVHVYE